MSGGRVGMCSLPCVAQACVRVPFLRPIVELGAAGPSNLTTPDQNGLLAYKTSNKIVHFQNYGFDALFLENVLVPRTPKDT